MARQRVVAAMSGGVDSSIARHCLSNKGTKLLGLR